MSDKLEPIRQFPAEETRVETGPVQFGDDWPGIFIRGDRALAMAINIEWILATSDDLDRLTVVRLRQIKALLKRCDLRERLEATKGAKA